jgi:hypothetical protein
MYLANNTRPDIAFAINCLTKHSTAPTMRYWNGIKNILWYLHGTVDLRLFYESNKDSSLIGYVDDGYLSDSQNARSQTWFVFLHRGIVISWKSTKHTLIATFTNHSEIITLYKASCECAWLCRMIDHIQNLCGIGTIRLPTIIYEDNAAYVT